MDEENVSPLLCNGCWNGATSEQPSVLTSCGHLYCISCIQEVLGSDDSTCPICNQLLTKSSCKAITVLKDGSAFQTALVGQKPEVATQAAMASIQFYQQQQELQSLYKQQRLEKRIEKVQEQCRKKLTEVHNGYLQAKRKYQEVQQARQALLEDNRELQEKYNQKAQHDKRLKDMLAQLNQENDTLRRANEQLMQRLGGGGGGGGGMQLQAASMGAGFGGGGGLGGGGRPGRAGNFDSAEEDQLGLRTGGSRRASLGGGGGGGRAPLRKELSPLQSPNFNAAQFAFETPANQQPVLRNVLGTSKFAPPPSASKPQLGMGLGGRRPSTAFLNTNSPSGMASL